MKGRRIVFLAGVILLLCSLAACGGGRSAGGEERNGGNEADGANKGAALELATDGRGEVLSWFIAHDIGEILGAEPYSAASLPETMPVYKNRFVTDGAGVPLEPVSKERMAEIGNEIAGLLGVPVLREESFDDDKLSVNHLYLYSDEIAIHMSGSESVWIDFGKAYPLPVDSQASGTADADGGREAFVAALEYTADSLKPLLAYWGMADPTPRVSYDYSFDGERNVRCELKGKGEYDSSVTVVFSEGYLKSIGKDGYQTAGMEVMGTYPTISYEEAEAILLAGDFWDFAISLDRPVLKEEIAGTLTGYKTQCYDEVFLPFYVFYVDVTNRREAAMPEESLELGLRNYLTCLVPAIAPESLKELPKVEAHFN